MAAGNPQLYDDFRLRLLNSVDDFAADNHYAILLTNAFSFAAGNTTLSQISANEVTDPDYAPQNLAGEAVSLAAGTVKLDANDVSFGDPVTITARWIVVLKGTVAAKAGTDLLCFAMQLDTAEDKSSTNGRYNVAWNASGIVTNP